LIFSTTAASFALDDINGWELSTRLEQILSDEGFTPKREILSFTGRDRFPFNISVTVNPDLEINNRNTIIVDILQIDALKNQREIINLMRKSGNGATTIIYVFSTLDSNLPDAKYETLGTELYASSYQNIDNSCAITLSFRPSGENKIHIGSYGKVSPLWMSRSIVSSFENTDTPFTLGHHVLSLYRLGLIKGDRRMSAYMANSIPAVGIDLVNAESVCVIADFLNNFEPEETDQWDNHYVYINLPLRSQWLNESVFVIVILIAASIILLLITFFSFIGKNKQINKNKLKSTWFMVPLTIGVSFLSLYTGQFFSWCLTFLFDISPVLQFGIKFIIAILFISALFTIQEQKKIDVDSFVYGYILTLISILNIFIFTAIDIMLLFPFFFEYIFIYISRAASKTKYLIISILLMLIPFSSYLYALLTSSDKAELSMYAYSSFGTNLLLTMALFPFMIMWLRLLKNLSRFQKEHESSHKKLIMKVFGTTLFLIGGAILFFTGLSYVSSRYQNSQRLFQEEFISSDKSFMKLSVSKQKLKGMTNYSLKLTSDKKPLRTEITLTSEETVPLFDSLYDYKISEEPGKAFLLIPDYPPQTLNINFASEAEESLILSVKSYYQDQDHKIIVDTSDFSLIGETD